MTELQNEIKQLKETIYAQRHAANIMEETIMKLLKEEQNKGLTYEEIKYTIHDIETLKETFKE